MKRFHRLRPLRPAAGFQHLPAASVTPFLPACGGCAPTLLPMKIRTRLLFAGFALAAAASLRAELSARAWVETYYLDPKPAELPAVLPRLSAEGFFDRQENIAVGIGFLASLFAQDPGLFDRCVPALSRLPAAHQRLVVSALWQSGHPRGPELLRTFARTSPVRFEVERLSDLPSQPLAETAVRSASSLRLQWGAFLATGDERHVVSILDGFGLQEPALTVATRAALARHAAAHPRVLEICRAQLERQPDEIRSELRAALSAAAVATPRT